MSTPIAPTLKELELFVLYSYNKAIELASCIRARRYPASPKLNLSSVARQKNMNKPCLLPDQLNQVVEKILLDTEQEF